MITLVNEVWQMEPNSLFHPTLLFCDHPFPNGLHFLKIGLFVEHNPSLTALVYLEFSLEIELFIVLSGVEAVTSIPGSPELDENGMFLIVPLSYYVNPLPNNINFLLV